MVINGFAPILALSLLSPTLFAWGAAAVSLPILIHLFARRRFRRIRWAAMDFLIDAEKRNKRRMYIEELILLVLRCLAILALAAMFARPFVSSDSVAAAWGGRQRVERLILIDDSYSMGYRPGDSSVFDRARQAVTLLVDAFRRETPQDAVTLLRTSDVEAPIMAAAALDSSQHAELLARLAALEPTQRGLDVAKVMQGAASRLSQSGEVLNAVIYVVSDFQQKDWTRRPSGGSSPGANLLEPLRTWAGDRRGLRVILVQVGEADAVNQAVSQLSIPAGVVVAGAPTHVTGGVVRYSENAGTDVELELTLGTQVQPTLSLPRLEARQPAAAEFEVTFPRPGFEFVRLELPPDNLAADDVRYAAVPVVGAVRVLIVNGEPASDEFLDEVHLLSTALRPDGEVFSGFEPIVIDEAGFEEAKLSEFHVVVLANLFRASPQSARTLEAFVADGGGLIVFGGDQVDPEGLNASLYREGQGLLPAAFGERFRPSESVALQVSDRTHPALRGMGAEGDPLGLGTVPFYEFHELRVAGEEQESDEASALGEPVAPTNKTPASAPASTTPLDARRRARVVARFTDGPRSAAIAEKAFGRGRVVQMAFPADKEWHTWPDHPTFLPVMLEFVHHAASPEGPQADHGVAEPVAIRIDPSTHAPDAVVRTPAFPDEPEVPVTAVTASDGQSLELRWEATGRAGVYQFALRRLDGAEDLHAVAVNVDATEGDLRPASEAELRKAMPEPAIEYIVGLDGLDARSGDTRVELWRGLWVVALVVLMSEQILAFRWGRRR